MNTEGAQGKEILGQIERHRVCLRHGQSAAWRCESPGLYPSVPHTAGALKGKWKTFFTTISWVYQLRLVVTLKFRKLWQRQYKMGCQMTNKQECLFENCLFLFSKFKMKTLKFILNSLRDSVRWNPSESREAVSAVHSHSGFMTWNSGWIRMKNPKDRTTKKQVSWKYFCLACIFFFFW